MKPAVKQKNISYQWDNNLKTIQNELNTPETLPNLQLLSSGVDNEEWFLRLTDVIKDKRFSLFM